jgi:hypothetical protein
MNKDENPSTKSTMHVKANVNTPKENQNNQDSSNEVEDPMLKGLSIANIQLFGLFLIYGTGHLNC